MVAENQTVVDKVSTRFLLKRLILKQKKRTHCVALSFYDFLLLIFKINCLYHIGIKHQNTLLVKMVVDNMIVSAYLPSRKKNLLVFQLFEIMSWLN